MSLGAQDLGQLLFDDLDGLAACGDALVPTLGEHDELRPPIARVGSAYDVTEFLELVDQLPIACGVMFARAASWVSRDPAGSICANTAECFGFCG